MKSKVMEKIIKENDAEGGNYIIECACGSPMHCLTFSIYRDKDFTDENGIPYIDMHAYINLNPCAPWYKRIYYAIKYIFKKEVLYVSDVISIDDRNIEELEEAIKAIKEIR
jgi:hypothetical protein